MHLHNIWANFFLFFFLEKKKTKSLWDKLSMLIAGIENPEQQLELLERFFCASFTSCHRSIVNSSVTLWNKLFEKVEHLDYPEGLKTALIQLQLHADIVVPGLESASSEFAGRQPIFIESFDDFNLSKISTRSSSRRSTPRPSSSHSKSPAALNLTVTANPRLKSSPIRKAAAPNRRKPAPRLRHDDSQVQFAAVDISPTHAEDLEPQVLTERQKEVRERQRENAALFPEIRSSPGKPKESTRQVDSPQVSLPENPTARHAVTPEPDGTFDDYVSSTPTPRRGQPVFIPEHDMTDPPSSPPEPRRNPLAAEIRSRSASHSLLEEWQFSSSPVSGSPHLSPTRHHVVPDPSGRNGYISVVSLPEVDVPSSPEKADADEESDEPQLPGEEVIEDSVVMDTLAKAMELAAPSTPPQPSKSRETPTPDEGAEVFVDAPTSPLAASPSRARNPAGATDGPLLRASQAKVAGAESFSLDEDDERSLLRLVIELDGRKVDPQEYHHSSASPEIKGTQPPQECTVIGNTPKKLGKSIPVLAPVPMRVTRSASRITAPDAAEVVIPSSQPTRPRGRPKRKRALTKEQDPNKRTRHESVEGSQGSQEPEEAPGGEAVPDPQAENASAGVQTAPHAVEQIKSEEVNELSMAQLPSSEEFSSPAPSSPEQVAGSQDSPARPENVDTMAIEVEQDDDDDDIEVQSQIALESFSASQRQSEEEDDEEEEEELDKDDSMHVDDDAALSTKENTPVVDAATEGRPAVQQIVSMLRDGLDRLRTARLSRQEVYRIEDMFMDMRRELYEAERRGRGT